MQYYRIPDTDLEIAKEKDISLRTAAYVLARRRLGAAADAMGTVQVFNGEQV